MRKIVSRTPLRISFVGGGTDLPSFYEKHGGAVISSAIDKYVTVKIAKRSDRLIEWSWVTPSGRISRLYNNPIEIQHPIFKECLRMVCSCIHIDTGFVVEVESDIQPRSGLGGSSALTVGLLNALHEFRRQIYKEFTETLPHLLAREACEIEIKHLGNPIGKQDQCIAAYGGFRRFTFGSSDYVGIEKIEPPVGFEASLMLFDTGIRREASKVLAEQKETGDEETLLSIKALVHPFSLHLERGEIESCGQILHNAWNLKRSLSPSTSNDQIDKIYQDAIDAGALGGKLLGAGGGGHFLFVVSRPWQSAVIKVLEGLATPVPFKFEPKGSRIADA